LEPADGARVDAAGWMKVGVLAGLFCLLNGWQFRNLFNGWRGDENWQHGFIIPLFSLFLLYNWRKELFAAERRICLWGLGVILLALVVMVAGVNPIKNQWIQQLSMPFLIFGLVLYLAGPKVARVAFVPIFFLCLAIPLPGSLYTNIAYPLQKLAAAMSGGLLKLFGVVVEVTESRMDIVSWTGQRHPLTVAEACSGVRSLMAFVALGVALAYIEQRPFWQRAVLILAGIPITIVCNILRVTVTSAMFVIDKRELGEDFMHMFTGLALLIPALLLLFGLSKLLDSMFIEEEDEEADRSDSAGPRPAQIPGDGS
jgi:exosortase